MPEIQDEIGHADQMTLWKNSTIEYEGRYYWVLNVMGSYHFHLWDLEEDRELLLNTEGVPLNSIRQRLGYVNHKGRTYYLERQAYRQFSAGLTRNNVSARGKDLPPELLRSKGLSDTLKGIYPSEAEVYAVGKAGGSIAFDRQFAVGKRGCIYYKENFVGTYDFKRYDRFNTALIQWHPGHEWLASLIDCSQIFTR